MAEVAGSIVIDLDANTAKFKQGMQEAEGQAKSFKDKMSAGWDSAVSGSQAFGVAIAATAVGVGLFAKQAFDGYTQANAVLIKLRTNLLTVKGNTEEHVAALDKQATAMEKIGVIDADNVIAGQSQLATFGLQASTIEKVTPKIADMAAQLKGYNVTAEDMTTLNNLAGKVLTGNVGALSKYGVTLSDVQKKVMTNGTETEKAAMMVEVLSQNYGKVNEALGKTPQGKINQLNFAVGQLSDAFGEVVANALTPMIDGFNNWMTSMGGAEGIIQKVKDGFAVLQPYIPAIGMAIMAGLVPALVAMAAALWANPITWIIAGVLALGVGITMLIQNMGGWDAFMKKIDPLMKAFKVAWDLISGAVLSLWDAFAKDLLPELQRLWALVEPILMPILKVLAVVLGVLIVGAIMATIVVLKLIVNWLSSLVRGISDAIEWWKNAWNWFMKVTGLGAVFSEAGSAIINGLKGAFDWVADKAKGVRDALNNLNPFKRNSPSLIDNIQAGAGIIKYEYSNLFKDVDRMSSNPAAAFQQQTNNNQVSTQFFGNITIGSDVDSNDFLARLSRNQELAQKGLATAW